MFPCALYEAVRAKCFFEFTISDPCHEKKRAECCALFVLFTKAAFCGRYLGGLVRAFANLASEDLASLSTVEPTEGVRFPASIDKG